jgi:activator of HSP90 ATPase
MQLPRTITLAASLPAPPDQLFDMYLDADAHAAFTGSPVVIGARSGAPFRAFDGVLTGIVLHVEAKRVVAQTWRSARWPAGAADSVLVLSFWPESEGGRIELVHVNVPEEDFAGVSDGWHKYYWAPWRAYLGDASAWSPVPGSVG